MRPTQQLHQGGPQLAAPSSVLFDRPGDGGLWALGATWKASFDQRGVTFIPFFGAAAERNYPLQIEVRGVAVGDQVLAVAGNEPVVEGTRVRVERGGFVEVFDVAMDAVEHSLVFPVLPVRGPLVVDLGFTTELGAIAVDGGLRFAGRDGHVDYAKAVAVDGSGRRLSLPITWRGDGARIEIPAAFVAQAELPLVLDPILTSSPVLAPTASNQRFPDVATLQNPDRILVTWQRQWSATDQDCFAAVYDTGWAQLSPLLTIDFTSENWLNPRAASNRNARNWLITAQVNSGTSFWVAGRLAADNTWTVGAKIDIERAGVVGLPGNTFNPDVGGDPWGGSLVYYCVVFEKEITATNRDIYFKLVRPDGSLSLTTPTVLANTSTTESLPSISKSNRTGQWMVVWQRQYPLPFTDQDVHGAFIRWDGLVVIPDFLIAGAVDEERAPSVSSPAVIATQGWHYLVAWSQSLTLSSQADIICAAYSEDGTLRKTMNLSATTAGGSFQLREQVRPRVESDGARFLVAYDEFDPGPFEFLTFLDTVALPFSGGTYGDLRVDDARVGTNFNSGKIASMFSGGALPSATYAVAGSSLFAPYTVFAYTYGGYQPGFQFSVFSSQCGSLPISWSGSTAVGNQVTISVPETGFSGAFFGTPGFVPLGGLFANCNCILGVANALIASNPLVFNIPPNPAFVGVMLSVQGYSAGGSSCLSILDLSDTVDFVIR